MPLNVVPLADGTLNVAMKRAAFANIGVVRNFQISIGVCFRRENGSPIRVRSGQKRKTKGQTDALFWMNDAKTLVLIHTVAWPILIWALSKAWSYA